MIKELLPKQAWEFMKADPGAVLIDVRSVLEYSYVGHPIGAVNIVWKEPPLWEVNPEFNAEVKLQVPDIKMPVLLLCRSGQRSLAAARQLGDIGYTHLINIKEGFEGPLDEHHHRGELGGWRFNQLPWEQS